MKGALIIYYQYYLRTTGRYYMHVVPAQRRIFGATWKESPACLQATGALMNLFAVQNAGRRRAEPERRLRALCTLHRGPLGSLGQFHLTPAT